MLCLSGFELHSQWVPLSHAVCLADLRNQLLCPKTSAMFPFSWDFPSCARQRNRSSFTDVHFWTCKYMGHKTDVCRFCSLIIEISFFVIPKVFFSLNVYSIAWIPVWGDLRLRVDSFSQTPAGNRAPKENPSKESSKEV